MNFLSTIISFIVMFAIIAAAYVLCRKFVFCKIRINKWIPLSIAIILLIAQIFLGQTNNYISYGLSIFTVLFFLWFMDIAQTGGPKKKEKQIVIKPKAKPNRVKKK
jgi:hydrogenase-4 membrane subunit HyfE